MDWSFVEGGHSSCRKVAMATLQAQSLLVAVDVVVVEDNKLFRSLTVVSDDIVALVATQRDLYYFHLWQSNDCHLSLLTVTKVVDLLFARIALLPAFNDAQCSIQSAVFAYLN
jgi:hypothetical protein